ncbi:hypothetical protein K439DRAFT_1663578 [Ramaria rubella]|nr:hypothetical protein K439DRAFT_1663578 [Ramaria rubella]
MIRCAKSGGDWTTTELDAYNIEFVTTSFKDFFGMEKLPDLPEAVQAFAATEDRRDARDEGTYKLLYLLNIAHAPLTDQKGDVDAFVARLLEWLGFSKGNRIVMLREALNFLSCTDVSIKDNDNSLLMLAAEGVAVFQHNNVNRVNNLGLIPLEETVIPAMAFYGSFPTFYKLRITRELSDAIAHGDYPPTWPGNIGPVIFRSLSMSPRSLAAISLSSFILVNSYLKFINNPSTRAELVPTNASAENSECDVYDIDWQQI